VIALARIVLRLLADRAGLVVLSLRSRRSVEAENLFLRRQLALFQERGVKPRRVDAATRLSLAALSRFFDWRDALVVVRPETLIRWHRAGWRLFWRLKSRPGRPPIPLQLRQLIRRMATENPIWGRRADCQRIVAEAWPAALTADRAQVHAEATSGPPARRSALGVLGGLHHEYLLVPALA